MRRFTIATAFGVLLIIFMSGCRQTVQESDAEASDSASETVANESVGGSPSATVLSDATLPDDATQSTIDVDAIVPAAASIDTAPPQTSDEAIADNSIASEFKTEKSPTADQARQHVQQYLDRFFGGDKSLEGDLFGVGLALVNVESAEIVRSLPKYSPEGNAIENWFLVVVEAAGSSELDGSPVEKQVDLTLIYENGKWRILGTKL